MSPQSKDGAGATGAVIVIGVGAWVALAPSLFGATTPSPLALGVLPGGAAVLAGLVMLAGRRQVARAGAMTAVAAGAWLVVAALILTLAARPPGVSDAFALLVWLGFFLLAGALLAVIGSGALGLFAAAVAQRAEAARCQARRRPAARRSGELERMRRHGAARRHQPPDGRAGGPVGA